MPWTIHKRDDKYCVVKESDGSTVHCHESEEMAKSQLAALYAGEITKALGGDDTVYLGGEVKALGDGRVGGYLVRFGVVDCQGDLFDPACDFGVDPGGTVPVYYHHGIGRPTDPHAARLTNRRFGRGSVEAKADGLWIEASLDLSKPGVPELYADAGAGRLGWSSGTSDRFVRFEPLPLEGKGHGRRLTQWHLNDASLTPTPVEGRNRAVTLKALMDDGDDPDTPGGDGVAPAPRLLDDLAKLATDAERLMGLTTDAIQSRKQVGRSISSAKLDAILKAGTTLISLHGVATAPRMDLADADAEVNLVGAYLMGF